MSTPGWEAAMARLRAVRDALNALDLDAAARRLAEHDARLREAFAAAAGGFTTVEAETLHRAQAELLAQLEAVQQGVARGLSQTRRSGAAARAYLGAAGGD